MGDERSPGDVRLAGSKERTDARAARVDRPERRGGVRQGSGRVRRYRRIGRSRNGNRASAGGGGRPAAENRRQCDDFVRRAVGGRGSAEAREWRTRRAGVPYVDVGGAREPAVRRGERHAEAMAEIEKALFSFWTALSPRFGRDYAIHLVLKEPTIMKFLS